jgi:hypothetical protein
MTIGELALLPVEEAQLIEQVAHCFLSSLRLRTTGPTGRLINLGLRQPMWLARSIVERQDASFWRASSSRSTLDT